MDWNGTDLANRAAQFGVDPRPRWFYNAQLVLGKSGKTRK
jgi:hypothetical protein